jgi:hypothetical protein
VAQPEQAALDWILRETGSDVWFSQPFGFLSVDRKAVHVYHTPQMHESVKSVIDRLNASKGESYNVALRVLTVGSPNWRSRAFATLQPVPVQTPGVEAWLLTRESATLLIAELKRRLDVTELEASVTPVVNGQSLARDVRRPKQYVKTVAPAPGSPAPYAVVPGSIDEGYQIQISPLIGEGGQVVDAVIRCRVDQVEKLIPVSLEVPLPAGGKQSVDVQVPQVSSSQMHERFRWPTDAVLLISGGMSAAPADGASKNMLGLATGLLEQTPPRADGLLFIEIQGRVAETVAEAPRTAENWNVSGGRY